MSDPTNNSKVRSIDIDLICEIQAVEGSPLVSIYIPTEKVGRDTEQNHIRFKNQLKHLEAQLDTDDLRALGDQWKALSLLEDNYEYWQHTGHGMAWFVSPEKMWHVSLPVAPVAHATAGRHFYIRPLFAALDESNSFRLLTISLNQVRLFRGDGYGLQPVDPPAGTPASLMELLGERDNDAANQAHSSSSRGSPGNDRGPIFHNQDEGEHSKVRIRKYLSQLAEALGDKGWAGNAPVVLAGVAYVTQMFLEAKSAQLNVIGSVDGNVDDATNKKLHERVWPVVQNHLKEQREQALQELFDLDPERVARTVEDVAAAALQGRVDTTYYVPAVDILGIVDMKSLSVHRIATGNGEKDDGLPTRDLVDVALQQTLAQGGTVYAVSEEELGQVPGQPVVARLRY